MHILPRISNGDFERFEIFSQRASTINLIAGAAVHLVGESSDGASSGGERQCLHQVTHAHRLLGA